MFALQKTILILFVVIVSTMVIGSTIVIPAQNAGSGVEWAPGFAQAVGGEELLVGADYRDFGFGQGRTSSQIRFDLTSIEGQFTQIKSAVLRLYQKSDVSGAGYNRSSGLAKVFRLQPGNATWINAACFGGPDSADTGTTWQGGLSGAMIPVTDYVDTLLGSLAYDPSTGYEGMIYDIELNSSAITALEEWAAGGVNEGFLIYADGPALATEDNRMGFTVSPELIVNYVPSYGPRTIQMSVTEAGSGVEWSPTYQSALGGELVVGHDWFDFGVGNGRTSSQLKFDPTTTRLAEFKSLISAKLILEQQGDFSAYGRVGSTVRVYQLTDENSDWNSSASFAYTNGTDIWAGGPNGGFVSGTDYVPVELGSVVYDPNTGSAGTLYDIDLNSSGLNVVDSWIKGVKNQGFILLADEPIDPNDDNRFVFTSSAQLNIEYELNFSVIDDMEVYDATNPITDTWIPGDLTVELEEAGVISDSQSMKITFDNASSPYYAQATYTFASATDFTADNHQSLEVWFHGVQGQPAEDMFIALTDSSGTARVFYENPSAISIGAGEYWKIPYSEFSGIDLSAVTTFSIGFGQVDTPGPGNAGTVYFDDIRIYEPRWVLNTLKYDLNDDSVVNLIDFGLLATEWLSEESGASLWP